MITFEKYYQRHPNYPTGIIIKGYFNLLKELLKRENNVAFVIRETKKRVPIFLIRYFCKFTPYFYRSKIYTWDNERNKIRIIDKPSITSKRCIPILFDSQFMRLVEKDVEYYQEKDHKFVDEFWGQFNDKFFKKQSLK